MQQKDKSTAEGWRRNVCSKHPWVKAANQAGASSDHRPGEAGGFFVKSEEPPGRRAYLKPVKHEEGKHRAAREKIAADLAHDLGVCVPPVLLTRRTDAGTNEETSVAVSLVLYPQQWSWNQLRDQLQGGSDEKVAQLAGEALPQAAAEALAFDTWLGQWDHGDHPHNIVFGYDPEHPEAAHSFVFLDYAFSMGLDGRWNDGKFNDVQQAPFPPLMLGNLVPEVLERTVGAIEALPEAVIRDTVTRIPDTHISSNDRVLIAEALCHRRQRLRDPLRSLLP